MKKRLGTSIRKGLRKYSPYIIAIICYVLCILFGRMMYHTNDEIDIQQTLAGNITGSPYPVHQFIGIWISYPISWLYTILPSVQWWYFCSHILLITGLMLVSGTISREAEKNGQPFPVAVVLIIVADLTFFIYPIANIAFTIVAGIAGTGALCLLLTWETDQKQSRKKFALALVLFFLALGHRISSGEVILCYMLLGLLYKALCFNRDHYPDEAGNKAKDRKKRGLALLFSAMILTGMTFGLKKANEAYIRSVNGEDYTRFNSARSAYMDYPTDSYDENPEIYEQVGWDSATYQLIRAWCFMPERATADSFRYLADHSEQKSQTISPEILLKRWEDFQVPSAMGIPLYQVWLAIGIVSAIVVLMAGKRKELLIILLNIIGTVLLIGYQLYSGRIIYRSVIIVYLPSTVLNLFILIRSLGKIGNRWVSYAAILTVAVLSLSSCQANWQSTFDSEQRDTAWQQSERDDQIRTYAINHPENIYITQIFSTQNESPWNIYPESKPINLISWGGSSFGTAAVRQQWDLNGISDLSGETMDRANTYLISSTDVEKLCQDAKNAQGNFAFFYSWLKESHGATGFYLEDTICDDLFIYQFVFSEPPFDRTIYDYRDGFFVKIHD